MYELALKCFSLHLNILALGLLFNVATPIQQAKTNQVLVLLCVIAMVNNTTPQSPNMIKRFCEAQHQPICYLACSFLQ